MAIFGRRRRAEPTEPEELPELEAAGFYLHAAASASAGFGQITRRLPVLIGQAFEIAWSASRLNTVLTLGFNLAAGIAITFGLLATRDVASALFADTPNWDRVLAAVPALATVGGAVAVRAGMGIAAGWAQARMKPLVTNMVEARFFGLTTRVPLAAFDDDAFSDDMQRARDRGVDGAVRLVDNTVDVVTGLVGMLAVAVAVAIIHPLLLVLLLVVTIPVSWAAIRSARIQYVSFQQRISRNRRVWLLENLMASATTAAETRAYQLGPWLHRQHQHMVAAETRADFAVIHRQTLIRIAGSLAAGVAVFAVYAALGWLLAIGEVPVAAGVAAVLALQQGTANTRQLTTAVNEVYHEGLYFADYTTFVTNASQRVSDDAETPNDREPPSVIRLDEVSLRYPGAETDAVSGVSAEIRHGETIALVGVNGSGKTSLAKLIATLYRPTGGTVTWDGEKISDREPGAAAPHVAVITQDYARWPFSARTNITIGRHDLPVADPDRIEASARAAEAHELITKLPQGYDTLLDRTFKGGTELSIGQWQRLACARGFYRDSPILICDEPSAALDPRAEAALFDQLRDRAGRGTTVLITHRLANVVHADRILVMEAGRLIESGSHAELLAADGHYAELFHLQAKHYIAED